MKILEKLKHLWNALGEDEVVNFTEGLSEKDKAELKKVIDEGNPADFEKKLRDSIKYDVDEKKAEKAAHTHKLNKDRQRGE